MPLSTRSYLNKLNKEVNRLQDAVMPVEYKYTDIPLYGFFDNGTFLNPANLAWQSSELTAQIAQGDTGDNRTGLAIKAQNLTIRGHVLFTSGQSTVIASTNENYYYNQQATCRMIIFTAKSNQSGSSNFTSYDNTGNFIPYFLDTAAGAFNEGPFNPKGPESRYVTNTLYDRMFAVDKYNPCHTIDINIPLNFRVTYNDVTSSAQENGIYIMFVCDRNEATSIPLLQLNCPYVKLLARVSFTDS